MIKTLIFDLGGVVFTSDGGGYENREILAETLGIDKEELHDVWFSIKDDFIKGKVTEEDYLNKIIEKFNLDKNLDFLKDFIKERTVIDPRMVELIKELKKKYVVVALTNEIREWGAYRIENFGLNELFEKIIASYEINLAKPDQKIYSYTLENLGVVGEETLFIDDRIENLPPAEDLGIKTFHYKDFDKFKKWLVNEKIL